MLTTNALTGPDAHYLAMFAGWGIPVTQAGSRPTTVDEERFRHALDPELVESVSPEIRDRVIDLAGELLADPPDILHCTLDYTNVVGAAAGLLVGVPLIVLSTRNVNPSTFSFYRPWMTPWYRFLAREPRVRFIANSHNGARDYARWMGVDASRIAVVLNGVDLEGIREPAAAEVAAVRAELGATERTPVVAGIFRLSWEKQPFVFLDVVQRVARDVPGLKVPLVGIGPLEREVRHQIVERRLSDSVVLLGQRSDVPAILAASDLLLLASAHEGTPNVVLEAEWLRRPVVATAVGGTPDAVVDEETGLLHGQRDAEALAGSVLRLLGDPALRQRFGQAGRQFVARAFSIDRMVDETLAVYGPPPASSPREAASPAEAAR
jgi:glycosyltransferase involved in cell wall biosynthesis